MEQLLVQFSETHRILTYAAVFIGTLLEGEITLVLAGILIKSGKINFFNTLIFSLLAVLVHDVFYWYIGNKLLKLNKKKFLFFNADKIENFLQGFKKREGLYLFVSKFAWNMNRFTLISSGYLKTPFKKIFQYSFSAAFIWAITFVSIGYIFAEQTDILKKDLKVVAIFITIFLIAVIFIERYLQKLFKKESKINGENNQKPIINNNQ